MDLEGRPQVLEEIERAKRHWNFEGFLVWLWEKYPDIPNDFEWGMAHGDPLEDLKDFLEWLVECKEGQWKKDDTEAPVGFDTLWLGTVPYTKKWETVLYAMTAEYRPRDLYVDAGGWIIDFLPDGTLKHIPAKSQFPLQVRFVEGNETETDCVEDNLVTEDTQECEDIAQEHAPGSTESWDYHHTGWDMKDEWESWVGTIPDGNDDDLMNEMEKAFDEVNSPLNEMKSSVPKTT